MNIHIAYYSATGNTRKVANRMAKAVSCMAESITSWKDSSTIDLLFLGAAVYANHGHGLHASMKAFISGLDSKKVKAVALFGTGFIHSDAIERMRDLAHSRGINVLGESFFCLGRFAFFNLGHPNAKDLRDAEDYAKRIVTRMST